MFSSSKMVAARVLLVLVLALGAQLGRAASKQAPLGESAESLLAERQLSAAQARELNRTTSNVAANGWPQQAGGRLQAARPQQPETNHSRRQTSHGQQVAASEPLVQSASSQARATLPPGAASASKLVAVSASNALSRPPVAAAAANSTSLAAVRLKWRQMEQSISGRLAGVSVSLRGELDELLARESGARPSNGGGGVSAACKAALREFLAALAEQELWASQMLDASATKLPSGLLEGTLTELGHFDECLAVASARPAGGSGSAQAIRGQHCSLIIKPALINRPRLHTICRRLPSLLSGGGGGNGSAVMRFLGQNSHQFLYAGLRLGVCAPSKCSAADLQQLLSAYLQPLELVGQVRHCQQQPAAAAPAGERRAEDASAPELLLAYLQQAYADSSILRNFDPVQQCILLAFYLLFLLTALGTWLDTSHRRRAGKFAQHSDVTNGLTSAPAAPLDAGGAPRRTWQEYQVCRSISTFSNVASSGGRSTATSSSPCQLGAHLAPAPPLPPPPHLIGLNPLRDDPAQTPTQARLGLQTNPIAELVAVGAASSSPSAASSPSSGLGSHAPTAAASAGAAPQQRAFLSPSSSSSSSTGLNSRQRELEHLTARARSKHAASTDATSSKWRQFLTCFSLATNLRAIGKGAPSSPSADIKVIHGMRTLSMIWIIFGHTIGLVSPEMMNNLFQLAQLACSSRLLQALLNTTLAVDTFFMISGLVTAVSFARKCRSARLLIGVAPANDGGNRPSGASPEDALLILQGLKPPPPAAARRPDLDGQSVAAAAAAARGCCERLEMEEEISSVDSASSASTSLDSSSASSNRCIGLKSTATGDCLKMGGKVSSSSGRGKRDGGRKATPPGGCWPSDFKPLMWLLMRYLRLTPAYAATIGLSIVLPALGSGPFWPETLGQLGPACRSNWWLNLLYLNNFLETDKLCLIHSWYLSNDWQFFLLALVLLAVLYKSRKLALLLLVSAAMASSAATFAATVEHEFPPTIVTTSPAVAERWQFIHQLYYKPWPHLPAYLVGLLVGYLLLLTNTTSTSTSTSGGGGTSSQPLEPLNEHATKISPAAGQLSRQARYLCWTLFALLALAVLNSIYPWNMGLHVDPLLAGLHSATFRTLWAACCGWLVYALATRPRNPLALLLAWHGFQVTSRLTYCAYLVHPLIIYYHFGTLRERLDSSAYGQLHRFMATLAQSYLCALLLSLLVESPSIQLQRFIARHAISERDVAPNQEPDAHHGHGHCQQSHSAGPMNADRQADRYWSAANVKGAPAHRAGTNEPACELHGHLGHQQRAPKGRRSSGSSSNSASAVDVEFQKKLAQAIGRGFKIRTKHFNGNSANSIKGQHQAARRPGQANVGKRHAGEQQLGAFVVPVASNERPETTAANPSRAQPKLVFAARSISGGGGGGDQLSTFSSSPAQQQHYVRPTSRKTVEEAPLADGCLLSSATFGQQQADLPSCCTAAPAAAADNNNLDLRQMIQMKHKLLTQRQQQRHDEQC